MFQCFYFLNRIIRDIFTRLFFTARISAVAVHHTVAGFPRDSKACRAAVQLHLFIHRLLESESQGDHDDDRCCSDDNTKDCQECAQLSPFKAACAHPQ